jgi:hypothetical protein
MRKRLWNTSSKNDDMTSTNGVTTPRQQQQQQQQQPGGLVLQHSSSKNFTTPISRKSATSTVDSHEQESPLVVSYDGNTASDSI